MHYKKRTPAVLAHKDWQHLLQYTRSINLVCVCVEKNAINLTPKFSAPLAPFRACRPAPGITQLQASAGLVSQQKSRLSFRPTLNSAALVLQVPWVSVRLLLSAFPAFCSGSSMGSRQHQVGGSIRLVVFQSKIFE